MCSVGHSVSVGSIACSMHIALLEALLLKWCSVCSERWGQAVYAAMEHHPALTSQEEALVVRVVEYMQIWGMDPSDAFARGLASRWVEYVDAPEHRFFTQAIFVPYTFNGVRGILLGIFMGFFIVERMFRNTPGSRCEPSIGVDPNRRALYLGV